MYNVVLNEYIIQWKYKAVLSLTKIKLNGSKFSVIFLSERNYTNKRVYLLGKIKCSVVINENNQHQSIKYGETRHNYSVKNGLVPGITDIFVVLHKHIFQNIIEFCIESDSIITKKDEDALSTDHTGYHITYGYVCLVSIIIILF